MFTRIVERKNKDGSLRHYMYIVQNKRQGKRTIQKNIASLGRIDTLSEGQNIENIVRGLSGLDDKLEVLNMSQDLEGESGQELGRIYLYRKIWEKAGIGPVLNRYFSDKKTRYDISEAILAMVINRLCAPSSKRDVIKWKDEVYEPKWEGLEEQHVYRAMDYLIDEKEAFEKVLFERNVHLFNQTLDVVMLDTTSIMHWGEGEHSDLLKHGHSKDRRGDLRQLVVGVVMTKEGMPIAHEVFEGNQNDICNFPVMIDALKKKYLIGEVVVVCDKGMMSPDNMMKLNELGYKYIVGVRLKGRKSEWVDPLVDKTKFKAVIRTEEKTLDVQDITREESIEYDRDPKTRKPQKTATLTQRYIVCHNPIEAKAAEEKRAYFKSILEKKIPYSTVKSWMKENGYRKYVKVDKETGEACLSVDYERLESESKYDGMWAIQTNWMAPSSEALVRYYKGLRQVEDGFKSLKSDIEIGPMYHWTSRRIRAHVFICFLSLILKTTFEKQLKAVFPELNPRDTLRDVKHMAVLRLVLNQKNIHLRTRLKGNAFKAFHAISAQLPPKFLKFPNPKSVVATP